MLSCFVDENGSIYQKNDYGEYLEYRFDLEKRMMTVESRGTESPMLRDAVARNHFDVRVGTPEKLINFVRENGLSKLELAVLLVPEKKQLYLDICARFEKALTEICTAKNDPCLEGGCALEGETCLNAVLEAGETYTTAHVSMWLHLFINPKNRISAWKS